MNNNSKEKDLEVKMDIAFTTSFLIPRKDKIEEFFTNILNSKFDYLENENPQQVYVIDIWYYALSPLSFIFAEPCSEYYKSKKPINIAELHLENYNYFDIEKLGRKVLDQNQVNYSELLNNEILDLAFFWENQFELEHKFLINCWKNAQNTTKSKILGFLQSSDGTGGIYDLQNDNYLRDKSVKEYLDEKGYAII